MKKLSEDDIYKLANCVRSIPMDGWAKARVKVHLTREELKMFPFTEKEIDGGSVSTSMFINGIGVVLLGE